VSASASRPHSRHVCPRPMTDQLVGCWSRSRVAKINYVRARRPYGGRPFAGARPGVAPTVTDAKRTPHQRHAVQKKFQSLSLVSFDEHTRADCHQRTAAHFPRAANNHVLKRLSQAGASLLAATPLPSSFHRSLSCDRTPAILRPPRHCLHSQQGRARYHGRRASRVYSRSLR
jgi:hypothetical protein